MQGVVILSFVRMGISAVRGNRNAQLLCIPLTLAYSLSMVSLATGTLSIPGVIKPWNFTALAFDRVDGHGSCVAICALGGARATAFVGDGDGAECTGAACARRAAGRSTSALKRCTRRRAKLAETCTRCTREEMGRRWCSSAT